MNKNKLYGFEMARISEVYLSTLSALMKVHGLERNFAAFMYVIENSGSITQGDLAIALKKDKVSTMRSVDYLSERDLIERCKDDSDRRCHILKSTKKAQNLLPVIESAIQKTNEILLADLTADEKRIFDKSMEKMMETITQLPSPNFIIKAHKRKKD